MRFLLVFFRCGDLMACKPPATVSAVKDDGLDKSGHVASGDGEDVLRVQANWNGAQWNIEAELETSGTPGLRSASLHPDGLGSYRGTLVDEKTGKEIGHASIGIGYSFRDLTRSLSFRFPKPSVPVIFKFTAESESTGQMEAVAQKNIDANKLTLATATKPSVEAKTLRKATATPAVFVNIYAEGYTQSDRAKFWMDVQKVLPILTSMPGAERFEVRGVFAESASHFPDPNTTAQKIDKPSTLLGLMFPYWIAKSFKRWQLVVYPADEAYFRHALASLPYDYPIALVNSSSFFGMGNYKLITAIPADHPQIRYLLTHEMGHFFGLNEEYDTGSTELHFSDHMAEPWSQNISLATSSDSVKWSKLIGGTVGFYPGGYGGDPINGRQVHKPSQSCTMATGDTFCGVCDAAIKTRIDFDAGFDGSANTSRPGEGNKPTNSDTSKNSDLDASIPPNSNAKGNLGKGSGHCYCELNGTTCELHSPYGDVIARMAAWNATKGTCQNDTSCLTSASQELQRQCDNAPP